MSRMNCANYRFMVFASAVMIWASPLFAAFTTSGVYDENTTNGRVVDVSATSDTGVEISLSSFTTLVDLAYQADAGGVIDFDNSTLTDPNTIDAVFGMSAGKSITITDGTIGTLDLASPASSISGNGSMRKTLGTFSFDQNDFIFDFDPDDGVKAVGATILSQFTLGQPVGNVYARVRYDDASVSPQVIDFIENSTSDDDTFWGFQAPEGRSITRFELYISNDKWAYLDDLAFVLDFERPAVTGDVNGDGFVGLDDLDIILKVWNQVVSDRHRADLNDDNYVGLGDLDIVLKNWNAGIPPAVAMGVPEPSVLLVLCGLASFGLNHRSGLG